MDKNGKFILTVSAFSNTQEIFFYFNFKATIKHFYRSRRNLNILSGIYTTKNPIQTRYHPRTIQTYPAKVRYVGDSTFLLILSIIFGNIPSSIPLRRVPSPRRLTMTSANESQRKCFIMSTTPTAIIPMLATTMLSGSFSKLLNALR